METKKKSYKKLHVRISSRWRWLTIKIMLIFFFKIMLDLIGLIMTSLIWQNHITILSFTILLFV